MVDEIKKIHMLERKSGVRIPIPHFFYVERYGRSVQEQMEELLDEVGKREWFLFKTDGTIKEDGLIGNFMMDLEKNAKLGKSYDECVLIEFSEEMYERDDFEDFILYLKSLVDNIYFVFTMKHTKNTASIQRYMEQYFFLRVIEAKKYTVAEQIGEIKRICREYCYELEEEAQDYIILQLKKREWKDEEQVLCRLKNIVCNFVYEQALKKETGKKMTQEDLKRQKLWVINLSMAKEMMLKMESENKKRAIIGFSQGGLQYE